MQELLASLGLVTLAEMGDKTQLLSFLLAARFPRKALPIIAGIFVATALNHLGAAAVGDWVAAHVGAGAMRWIVGIAFLAFAVWALVPDTIDPEDARRGAHGAFLTSVVAFFIAEMGDKTQLATIALGAEMESLAAVVVGTTLGMMVANVPAVLVGDRLAQKIPLGKLRYAAAASFAVFGGLVLAGVDVGLRLD